MMIKYFFTIYLLDFKKAKVRTYFGKIEKFFEKMMMMG